ncbi:ABC transporter permease [Propioniciclava tarda]|uniref:ABC transporter permease n=1 Tax=Propioniciclava tarda TaxID=433330 RepID=A0A4Q9KIB4_PROTD|nr:ABC transporter permease [Propioniciclava tarda]
MSVAGTVPFFAYTAIFLVLPTLLVVVGAFRSREGVFTLNGITQALSERTIGIFINSLVVSAVTALIGAVAGALIAYALATAPSGSLMRRTFTAFMSVVAQFGGVMLAFAFIATIGINGMVTRLMTQTVGFSLDPAMLSTLFGVGVVYIYFQIPLMVIVFLPALDGLKPQWREATANLGGTGVTYWTRVAGPILLPSFLGSYLLLFANSFSAFATAAALISQQTIIVPMEIESALRNENDLGMDAYAQALALGMIIVVALVMWGYAVLGRRASRWQA